MLGLWQITLINLAIFFGHYVIISTALNLQFGNAGIPNMSSNISVACGAYVVSSVVLRICMWVGGMAGYVFRPDWVYDNPYNVAQVNKLFETRPLLSLSIFFLALSLAFVLGSLLGWTIGAITGKLRSTYLMIVLLVISDAGSHIAANNSFIAGGTLGAFAPNFFKWYEGEHMIIVAVSIMSVGLVCYFIVRAMLNSPFGRIMRAVRDNEVTFASMGKSVSGVRRQVMMFGSGMMAVAGVLFSLYFSFIQYQLYSRVNYTFWPWLMIIIGGIGNNAGAYFGTLICVSILRVIWLIQQLIRPAIIGTMWVRLIDNLRDILMSSLLCYFMMKRPRGFIPERLLSIPRIDYSGIVFEKLKGDLPGYQAALSSKRQPFGEAD